VKPHIIFVLLVAVSSSFAQVAPPKFIEVTGFAEKEITADYLEMSVIIKDSDNLKKDTKDNDFAVREKNVLEAIKKIGIAQEDIRVDNFDVYRYGMSNSSNRYSLSKTYLIKVRNLESINEFTIRLFEAGANDLNIVRRVRNELEKYKSEAVKEAVENARLRATQIASTLNVTLGQAIQVSEVGGNEADPIPRYNPYYQYQKLSATGAVHRAAPDPFSPAETSPSVDIRKMKVTYRVLIQFEILK
jgi:uncharacterized protein